MSKTKKIKNGKTVTKDRLIEILSNPKIKNDTPMYLRTKGPHIGLYANKVWIKWVNKKEIEELKEAGVISL